MKLREQILKEHSKANCDVIIKWVGDSQQRFDELFDLFLNDEYRVVQRAGWPVSYAVIAHPKFILKHFSKLLMNLQKPNLHNSVKRNTIRLLQDLSKQYPEIKPELKTIIEDRWDYESAAFRLRAKKILKRHQ